MRVRIQSVLHNIDGAGGRTQRAIVHWNEVDWMSCRNYCLATLSLSVAFSFTTFFANCIMSPVNASSSDIPKNSWKELADPANLYPVNGARYFQFSLANGTSAYLVVAYIKDGKWRLRPFLGDKTAPTSRSSKAENASAGINGGFFNLSDGVSASYVVLDGKTVADPRKNKALLENQKLQPFLEQIFNRSEIRVLKTKQGKFDYQIATHNAPLPPDMKLVDSLQAGPQLLPVLRSEEEAFLRKQADGTYADSIGCKKPAARSAVGFTSDGYMIILAVAGKGQDPESSGITLEELSDLMRRLGCASALNLDGGSSTTLYVRLAESGKTGSGKTVVGKDPETLVKSILHLHPN